MKFFLKSFFLKKNKIKAIEKKNRESFCANKFLNIFIFAPENNIKIIMIIDKFNNLLCWMILIFLF